MNATIQDVTLAAVGGNFYHQVVAVELDVTGSIQALTSSNALALTIGSS